MPWPRKPILFDTFVKTDRAGWFYPGAVPLRTEDGGTAPGILVGGYDGPKKTVNAAGVAAVAQALAPIFGAVAIDAREKFGWLVTQGNGDKLRSLFAKWRAAQPDICLSVYGCINRKYWGFDDAAGVAAWRASNDALAKLWLTTADFFAIDCYPFYQGTDAEMIPRDAAYMNANIDEAKRVAGGRDVVVYMMTELHPDGTVEGDRVISPARWAAICDVVYSRGAHLAIWGVGPWTDAVDAMFAAAVARANR